MLWFKRKIPHFKYIKIDKGKYQEYKSIYTDPSNVIVAFKFLIVHLISNSNKHSQCTMASWEPS